MLTGVKRERVGQFDLVYLEHRMRDARNVRLCDPACNVNCEVQFVYMNHK